MDGCRILPLQDKPTKKPVTMALETYPATVLTPGRAWHARVCAAACDDASHAAGRLGLQLCRSQSGHQEIESDFGFNLACLDIDVDLRQVAVDLL